MRNPLDAPLLDPALVARYDAAVPRYTSYPSAAHFHDGVGETRVREHLAARAHAPRALSLYVHLPFCRSLCWYCGCTTVITRRQAESERYLELLQRELLLLESHLHPASRVVQVHLGGGTPTFFTAGELRQLGRMLHGVGAWAPGVEAGVEIDPRRLGREQVAVLADAGFNRASIGVQDHDPAVQRAVNRIQPPELTARAVEWLRAEGFGSLNVDLIYGLPHQTPESFARTIDDVLALRPDRLAVFGYAHVPWLRPAQRLLEREGLPGPAERVALLGTAAERLAAAGYVHVGLDHFARPDDALALAQAEGTLHRNFQGYSTHAGAELVGVGMSAISHVDGLFWQNDKDLAGYAARLADGRLPAVRGYAQTADDRLREQVIMRLLCDLRLDFAVLSGTVGVDLVDYLAPELEGLGELVDDGLVVFDGRRLEVTELGRFFLRNIAHRFDAHAARGTGRYSKAV